MYRKGDYFSIDLDGFPELYILASFYQNSAYEWHMVCVQDGFEFNQGLVRESADDSYLSKEDLQGWIENETLRHIPGMREKMKELRIPDIGDLVHD